MPGEVVAVDDDFEVKVQPHWLGYGLAPGNPLSRNDDVVQRHRLALAGRGARDAVVVRERVDGGPRSDGCLDRHVPVSNDASTPSRSGPRSCLAAILTRRRLRGQVHTVPLRSYANNDSTASETRGP